VFLKTRTLVSVDDETEPEPVAINPISVSITEDRRAHTPGGPEAGAVVSDSGGGGGTLQTPSCKPVLPIPGKIILSNPQKNSSLCKVTKNGVFLQL
jgi:hypothetical protein